LKALGELLLQRVEDEEYCMIRDETVEKLLRHALDEIRRAHEAWKALSDEGEYVAADLVPSLTEAVRAKGGRLRLGNYVYILSKNEKWLQRYARGGGNNESGLVTSGGKALASNPTSGAKTFASSPRGGGK